MGGSGGAERQFFLFARGLTERGWKVSFITEKPSSSAYTNSTIFRVYHAKFSYLGGSKLRMFPNWATIWKAMAKANTASYVVKTPAHLLIPMSFFCRVCRRKLVFWTQTSHDSSYIRRDINRVGSKMQDWGLRRADIVIAQTEDQRKEFKANYGIKAKVVPSICDSLIELSSEEISSRNIENPIDFGLGTLCQISARKFFLSLPIFYLTGALPLQ